jgi:uncharacterized membrane protein YkvA (DUF1232 family)
MNVVQIDRMVEDIKAAERDEKVTRRFQALQVQWANLQGRDPDDDELQDSVQFALDYVWRVPLLLLAMQGAAAKASLQSEVDPLLDIALGYWTEPSDLLPDDLGLFGLVDDAYYVLSILQMISDQHRRTDGQPVLALDLTALNERMRSIIGEPHASVLEAGIMVAIGAPSLQHLLLNLPAFSQPLVEGDPLVAGLSPDVVAARQLNAYGVVRAQ